MGAFVTWESITNYTVAEGTFKKWPLTRSFKTYDAGRGRGRHIS